MDSVSKGRIGASCGNLCGELYKVEGSNYGGFGGGSIVKEIPT